MDWDAPTHERVRRWVGQLPRPAKVRGEDADGDEIEVTVAPRGRLADVSSSLDGCVKLLALDREGTVTRALRLDDIAPPRAEVVKKHDADEDQIVKIARLLDEAHDKGHKRSTEAASLGWKNIGEIMQETRKRNEQLERERDRSYLERQRELDARERRLVAAEREAEERDAVEREKRDDAEVDGFMKPILEAGTKAVVEKMFSDGGANGAAEKGDSNG